VSLTDLHSPIDGDSAPFGQREVRSPNCADLKHATSDDTGRNFPLGATVLAEGVNFSVISRQASRVELLLFDDAVTAQPMRVIELDVRAHRTYHYWRVFVPGIGLRSTRNTAAAMRALRMGQSGFFKPRLPPPFLSLFSGDAGHSQERRTLADPRRLDRPAPELGIVTHDVHHEEDRSSCASSS
jgi:Carbohydrate-binding module 48 (Isoamylase N-terminal domain)